MARISSQKTRGILMKHSGVVYADERDHKKSPRSQIEPRADSAYISRAPVDQGSFPELSKVVNVLRQFRPIASGINILAKPGGSMGIVKRKVGKDVGSRVDIGAGSRKIEKIGKIGNLEAGPCRTE